MNLTDDEVVWISALLNTSKSKLISEYSEVSLLKQKIDGRSREIIAKHSRSVIQPGKFS